MATPTGAFDTVQSVGDREDLSDVVYNIAPTETPFMMMCGRAKAKQIKTEWQTDDLATASTTNAKIEGEDASFVRPDATVRVGNYTQIADKTVQVTGTQDAINKAGRRSELAYQIAKRGKELKRDLEAQLTSNQASVAGNRTTARVSGSLRAWLATNDDLGGGAAASGGYNTGTGVVDAATNGDQRPFLESNLKDVIAECWDKGGDPTVIMVGKFNKRIISGFTGHSTRYDRGEDKRLVAAIDVYVSDFGEHRIVPNRFQPERTAYVLTPRLWKIAYLRGFRQFPIAKTGDSEKRQLLCEYTLKSLNEAGSGCVADLNTT